MTEDRAVLPPHIKNWTRRYELAGGIRANILTYPGYRRKRGIEEWMTYGRGLGEGRSGNYCKPRYCFNRGGYGAGHVRIGPGERMA